MKLFGFCILIGLPLVLSFISCRGLGPSPHGRASLPTGPNGSPPQALMHAPTNSMGTVTVINESHQFVLLDIRSLPYPSAGTLLVSASGSQQTALLRTASPSRPPFLIADIVQGRPFIGDQIYLKSIK